MPPQPGTETETRLGKTDHDKASRHPGVSSAISPVAVHGNLEAASQGAATDHGDAGAVEVGDSEIGRRSPFEVREQLCVVLGLDFGQIGSGDERSVRGTGKNQTHCGGGCFR